MGKKVSVMRVLTLLLGHELDKQLDKVLWLARKYDENENAFRFRYGATTANGCSLADPAIDHLFSAWLSLSLTHSRPVCLSFSRSVSLCICIYTCHGDCKS